MNRFARVALVASMLLITGNAAMALTADETALRDKLVSFQNQTASQAKPMGITGSNWQQVAARLAKDAPSSTATCNEVNKSVIMGAYVFTSDAQNKPCRIYDLSFPTLETLFAKQPVSHMPVQRFAASDYLHWLNGDYQSVLDSVSHFSADMTSAPLASWVSTVHFRSTFVKSMAVAGTGLPRSFHASDLDTGAPLQFSAQDRQALNSAILAASPTHDLAELGAWQELVNHPDTVLSHIRFDWNDATKVYDIFIEGQFLPIRGPIALVDYNASYKIAVEGVLRSVVHTALSQVVRFIPGSAQALVSIALDDTFEFLDMAYEYQINKFEGTFNHATNMMDSTALDRGLNILAAGHTSFVSEYIMATVQGKAFDWSALEDAGRTIRYDDLNNRDIEMTNLNSSMVLDQGCQMKLTNDYFGICTKNGKSSMYSMISENSILMWNLGAPLLYNYNMPSEVVMRRGAAYMLSIGSRLFDLPYVGFLLSELTSACKTFAYAGVTDEAFLRSSYGVMQATKGQLDATSLIQSKWLYMQNLNVFLPKSEAMEKSVIQANANLLGLTIQ